MKSAEWGAEQQQMQEELRMDAHRIFAYLERHIAPKDVETVKYLMGIDEISRKRQWAEMACTCESE